MTLLWAEQALTAQGWQNSVSVSLADDGTISEVCAGRPVEGQRVGILLASPVNLHSHAFQRAMAGLTESRGRHEHDSFWTWRELMYRFLGRLRPDDVEAIAAFAQMEMLEAGYGAVCEFHYLHHQPGGEPYANVAELSARIAAAASESGIGLTLLPVLYECGGCDGRPLGPEQLRIGNDRDRFQAIFEGARAAVAGLGRDACVGVAPHSLRAVSREGLAFAVELAPDEPMHIHVAEQSAEVDEVQAAWGARPVQWLLSNHDIDSRWCFVHATQMEPSETVALAQSGAIAGLCPITESNLGDGIFDGARYLQSQGRFGIGTDSNVRISLSEELRTLEYSQRLRDNARAVLATADASTGRVLFEGACQGGAQAAKRHCGAIEAGRLADLVALDAGAVDLQSREGDTVIDSFVFSGSDAMVSDVWSAGRHLVADGHHIRRERIEARYRDTMSALRADL